jgi:hypothetical protein
MGWRLPRGDPSLAALEAIARRSTQVFSAETMPWRLIERAAMKVFAPAP